MLKESSIRSFALFSKYFAGSNKFICKPLRMIFTLRGLFKNTMPECSFLAYELEMG